MSDGSRSDGGAGYGSERGPAGTRFTEVRRFDEVDSTNRYLIDEARGAAPDGLVAVADHQTAGRGRLGRRWEAPPGANLLVSVLLRLGLAAEDLHLCTVAMALAARSACSATAGVDAMLKWPNDVVIGERKLAGVLAESVPEPRPEAGSAATAAGGQAVVVGLGVNVGWPPPDGEQRTEPVPDEIAAAATSLWRESLRRSGGRRVRPRQLLDVVLVDLEYRLGELTDADGRRRQLSEYRRLCGTLGRAVVVSLPGETFSGGALDITEEGHLLVDVGACIRTVTAGDVVHLRARR